MKPELINSLKGYKAKYLLNDLMSGLLVAFIAMPLSIALGIQSIPSEVSSNGLQMGLITVIIGGFFISLAGGSRFQVGGPTASFFIIIYNYLANPEIGLLGLQFSILIAGVLLMIMGFFKAGKIMEYMPYPIVIGFTAGVGITIMGGQLKDLFGVKAVGADFVDKMVSLVENIDTFNWVSFVIGIVGLAIILIVQKVNRKIPGALIALIVCTAITVILQQTVGDLGIETIGSRYGDIKAEFYLIDFSSIVNVNIAKIIVPSITIAFLVMIESLLSATVADGMANTVHDPNQELVGQGLANIFCSFFGGLPAIGAIARTSANIRGGAKSSLAGIFHAIFVLIMYFALMGVVKYIPFTAFAAILIVVAINMSNFPLVVKLLKFGHRDSLVLGVTFLLTIFTDMIYGVLGGILLTIIVNIPNMINKLSIETVEVDGKIINRVHGAVYFISVNKLIQFLYKSAETCKEVTVDLSCVKAIDDSSVERMAGLNCNFKARGKSLQLINYNDGVKKRLDKRYFAQ